MFEALLSAFSGPARGARRAAPSGPITPPFPIQPDWVSDDEEFGRRGASHACPLRRNVLAKRVGADNLLQTIEFATARAVAGV